MTVVGGKMREARAYSKLITQLSQNHNIRQQASALAAFKCHTVFDGGTDFPFFKFQLRGIARPVIGFVLGCYNQRVQKIIFLEMLSYFLIKK